MNFDLTSMTCCCHLMQGFRFICAVATPADAALMMQMGCDGVFVGSVSTLSRQSCRGLSSRGCVSASYHPLLFPGAGISLPGI